MKKINAPSFIIELREMTQLFGSGADIQRMKIMHLVHFGLTENEARFFLGHFLFEPDEFGVVHKELQIK